MPHPAPSDVVEVVTPMRCGPDRIVVVDWSAAAVPRRGADSIWQATARRDSEAVVLANPSTRAQWRREATDSLGRALARGERVLMGVDASLGFPRGFARLVAGPGAGWREVWDAIAELSVDGPDNANNRFEVAAELNRRCGAVDRGSGPFWGHPPGREHATLGTRRPSALVGTGPLGEWRTTEAERREAGQRGIQSTWKLHGAGSVGGQALTAIHQLVLLRRELERRGGSGAVRLWPQETGAVADPWAGRAGVVVAETWPPGAVAEDPAPGAPGHGVRDAGQVAGLARALRLDAAGDALAARFERPAVAPEAAAEEGWIL